MANRPAEMSDGGGQHPGFDADAVCAQCGTVNPEGTLLCKACGINLREQRELRLSAAQQLATPAGGGKTGWLSKALAALGILVVVWVAINIKNLEDFLVSANLPSGSEARVFWDAASGQVYDELLGKLDANPITDAELEMALSAPQPSDVYEGRFVLMLDDSAQDPRQVGQAFVQQTGQKLVFAAVLRNGVEVRGDAWLDGQGRPVARDSAGVQVRRGEYFIAFGVAMQVEKGVFECYGGSDNSDSNYTVMAYRVPFPEEYLLTP